jgi:sodium transport system permease protein
MKPYRAAFIVLKKELRESLRDRKTLIIMVLLPLLLYPMLFLGLSAATIMQVQKLEQAEVAIGLSGPIPPELRVALSELDATTVVEVGDARHAVSAGDVVAAIRVENDPATLEREETLELSLFYDGGSDQSREGQKRVEQAFADVAKTIQSRRLASRGLVRDFIEPLKIKADDVAPPLRQGGWLLGQVLPMLICLLMIGATFYPAIDLTAGEKERGTLQTLLTAPISPTAIVVGKYMTVVCLGMLTALVNLSAIGLVILSVPLPDSVSGSLSFGFGWDVFLLSLVCLVLIGMVFGALMMAVAVTAKSFKEAQNYLTPLYLVCVFPLMLTSLPGIQLDEVTAALPLVNLALCIKQLLLGDLSTGLFFEVLVTTAAWITLAVVLATRVFRMESVLLGHDGVSALFRRGDHRERTSPRPTLGEVSTLLGIVLLLIFYVGIAISEWPILVQIHLTQWGLLLVPTLLLVKYLQVNPRLSLAWTRPAGWALFSAVLFGSGTWWVAMHAVGELGDGWTPVANPALEELARQFNELGSEPGSAILLFAGVALAPAICEEFLFRGLVLGALRTRAGAVTSVTVSALLFALFHLNIYQLPTAFFMGLVLGSLTVACGSVWPAVLLHFLHNGLALGFQLYNPVLNSSVATLFTFTPLLGLIILVFMRNTVQASLNTVTHE